MALSGVKAIAISLLLTCWGARLNVVDDDFINDGPDLFAACLCLAACGQLPA
jgi:hypothetical protein